MDANFACPHCGKRLALDQKWIGREVQCPFCNSVFLFDNEMIDQEAQRQAIPADVSTVSSHRKPSRNIVLFEMRPIGFWARVVATIIDTVVTLVASVIVAFMAGIVIGVIGGNAELFGQFVGIATSWLYCSLMEASDVQATLGKLVIGAKVVDANGEKLTFGRATGRHFAKYISTLLLFVGYIMVAFDERKRGLHDMISGTYVVSRR